LKNVVEGPGPKRTCYGMGQIFSLKFHTFYRVHRQQTCIITILHIFTAVALFCSPHKNFEIVDKKQF